MLTRADIHTFLKRIGIKPDDTVLIHTSMRSLGEVEGGCDGLIDAFTSYLTDGLFLVPTHTWSNVGKNQPVYDVSVTEPCIGALPRVAAFRRDGVRSLHPTHSVSAFGKRAAEFVKGEEFSTSPCFEGGVWRRLFDERAKILLIGVGLNRNTFIHAIDEMIDLPDRLAPPIDLTVIDYNGRHYSLKYQKHGKTGSENFENYRKPLQTLGALKNDKLGNAVVGIFDAVKGTEVISMLWSKADYDLCQELKDIPEEYYQ
ncbi:MAG: AAC(3) family N-acetyltransferase [Clostridia bacterium]|nr:AAC(3) family N-acetyltransferase [Clostridia bacterium]